MTRTMKLAAGAASLLLATAAAAQDKGTLNLLCSVELEWCALMSQTFERETGVKVNMLRKSTGDDGWSLRGQFSMVSRSGNPLSGRTGMGTYAYHAAMRDPSGDFWPWPLGRLAALGNNRWYCVEQYLKLNTPGKSDGILRAWIDGRLVVERTDIQLRNVPQLRIESVWFNVYHGGTLPAPRDMHLYIDNVVVARRYVGPMAGAR